MCPDIFVGYPRIKIFRTASLFFNNHLFFSIFLTPHSVLTFCLPSNLLFVYPPTNEILCLFTPPTLLYCYITDLRYCSDWTAGSKAGCPKKGARIKLGLEAAMAKAKGKAGTYRTKATKRRRCDVCGAYGHMYEDCFLLKKSGDIEPTGIRAIPIEDIAMDDDGREYML
jgi:hypothetical protein